MKGKRPKETTQLSYTQLIRQTVIKNKEKLEQKIFQTKEPHSSQITDKMACWERYITLSKI